MEHLSKVLQHEEALLELLLFKLIETRLLLAADEVRFLPRATREVERARHRTREADLLRAASVAQAAVGRASEHEPPTLRAIAATSEEPWASIHRDHHEALCALVSEVEVVAHQNSCLARQALGQLSAEQPIRPMVAASTGPPLDVTPQRLQTSDPTLARLAAGAAYDGVLGAASRLHMPALLTFLR